MKLTGQGAVMRPGTVSGSGKPAVVDSSSGLDEQTMLDN